MATADNIVSSVLSKTLSGKLKWENFSATIKGNYLSLDQDDLDRPRLTIRNGCRSIELQGEDVSELYAEVDSKSFGDDSNLMDDLDDL